MALWIPYLMIFQLILWEIFWKQNPHWLSKGRELEIYIASTILEISGKLNLLMVLGFYTFSFPHWFYRGSARGISRGSVSVKSLLQIKIGSQFSSTVLIVALRKLIRMLLFIMNLSTVSVDKKMALSRKQLGMNHRTIVWSFLNYWNDNLLNICFLPVCLPITTERTQTSTEQK